MLLNWHRNPYTVMPRWSFSRYNADTFNKCFRLNVYTRKQPERLLFWKQKDFFWTLLTVSHHYIVMFCVYYIQIQGLPPLEDPACAVCKGCVLCRPGKPELSPIKWDGSSLQTCPTASLTVPPPNKTLPMLPSWGFNTLGKWTLHSSVAFEALELGGSSCVSKGEFPLLTCWHPTL